MRGRMNEGASYAPPQPLNEVMIGGTLKYQTVAQGIERAPEAFIGLLKGDNLGKQLVRLICELVELRGCRETGRDWNNRRSNPNWSSRIQGRPAPGVSRHRDKLRWS